MDRHTTVRIAAHMAGTRADVLVAHPPVASAEASVSAAAEHVHAAIRAEYARFGVYPTALTWLKFGTVFVDLPHVPPLSIKALRHTVLVSAWILGSVMFTYVFILRPHNWSECPAPLVSAASAAFGLRASAAILKAAALACWRWDAWRAGGDVAIPRAARRLWLVVAPLCWLETAAHVVADVSCIAVSDRCRSGAVLVLLPLQMLPIGFSAAMGLIAAIFAALLIVILAIGCAILIPLALAVGATVAVRGAAAWCRGRYVAVGDVASDDGGADGVASPTDVGEAPAPAPGAPGSPASYAAGDTG